MVQPSPFQRLLQDVSKEARTDPGAAFGRLDDLFGKTTTETDLLHLGAYATNLGVGALGRFAETERLLRLCLDHASLTADSSVRRSLHRALAVTLICADRRDDATAEIRQGVSSPADECRLSGAAAQTLLARNRPIDALPFLRRATELCAQVSPTDDVLVQTAGIASNLLRIAEPQCQLAQELVTTACLATVAAAERGGDWQAHHQALFHLGRSWLMAAQPLRTLITVQSMLRIEREQPVTPVQRFYSANLACRAQAMRGQLKIARAAFLACQEFATEAEQAGEPLGPALEDLERVVATAQSDAAVSDPARH